MLRKCVAALLGALLAFAAAGLRAHDEPQAKKQENYGRVIFKTRPGPYGFSSKDLAQALLAATGERKSDALN